MFLSFKSKEVLKTYSENVRELKRVNSILEVNNFVIMDEQINGVGSGNLHAESKAKVAMASGTTDVPPKLLNRQRGQFQAYARKFRLQMQKFLNSMQEKTLHEATEAFLKLPGWKSGRYPDYHWCNVYVAGPFQELQSSGKAPNLPDKIIQPAPTFLWIMVWRNPAPIDWIPGNPSAAKVMNGTQYKLCCQMRNQTRLSRAADVVLKGTFEPDHNLETYLLAFSPTSPRKGLPELYELHVALTTLEEAQPMAAFATWVYDLDMPAEYLLCSSAHPGFRHQPMRFLVYAA
ncbi:MAG: hypothetical protein D6814_03190 [Calditrichaeota bacterium]|nr:MAG: hypothetical protein D6814_03190 [Calditrichota bacterium]